MERPEMVKPMTPMLFKKPLMPVALQVVDRYYFLQHIRFSQDHSM